MFTRDNFITVPGYAVKDLGLSGNELLVYSMINGFSQDAESVFKGSLNYLSDALNISKNSASGILSRLVEKGVVEKIVDDVRGVRFCSYRTRKLYTVQETCIPSQNFGQVSKKLVRGVQETCTNNIEDIDKDNIAREKRAREDYLSSSSSVASGDIDGKNDAGRAVPAKTDAPASLFSAQSVNSADDARKSAKSPEIAKNVACLFAESPVHYFAAFADALRGGEFPDADLRHYFGACADWSASTGARRIDWVATARSMMRRDAERGQLVMSKESPAAVRREVPAATRNEDEERSNRERTKRSLAELFGTYKIGRKLDAVTPLLERVFIEILSAAGVASPDVAPTGEEIASVIERKVSALLTEGRRFDAEKLREAGISDDRVRYEAMRIARRREIARSFDSLISSGGNIEEILQIAAV